MHYPEQDREPFPEPVKVKEGEDPRIGEVYRRMFSPCPNTVDGRHYHCFTPYLSSCIYCNKVTHLPEGEERTIRECLELGDLEDQNNSDVVGNEKFTFMGLHQQTKHFKWRQS